MSDTNPRVSFIIPTLNQTERLLRCLESIYGQSGTTYEVLVVNNGKPGRIADIKDKFENVMVLELGSNHGYAVACNRGISASKGLLIALVNDDVVLHPNWLITMVAVFEEYPGYSSCASNILYLDRAYRNVDEEGFRYLVDCQGDGYLISGFGYKRKWGEFFEPYGSKEVVETFGANAAASIYERSFFDDVGLFDESFFCFSEDVDLNFRGRLRGHRCCYVPKAHAFHAVRATAVDRTDVTVYYSYRNFLTTWLKNMPLRLMSRYLFYFLIHQLFVAVRFLFLPGRNAYYRALLDFLKRVPQTVQKRKTIQREATNKLTKENLMLETNWVRILLDFRASRKRLDAATSYPMEDHWIQHIFPDGLQS